MSWSPNQYTKFERERNRPIIDLLNNVPVTEVRSAVDIGCGPGNSTELLLAKYPNAQVAGIDSSEDMIAAASKRLPNLDFQVADIENWQSKIPPDIILANAVLQWLSEHKTLLPALVNKLAPGGSLAIQLPDNLQEPAHLLMRKLAATDRWAKKLENKDTRAPQHSADWYYHVLRNQTVNVDIWKTTYYHALDGGASAIVEWFKGSGLRPFLDALSQADQQSFLQEYEMELSKAYHVYPDGKVLLPFPRLFILATKNY